MFSSCALSSSHNTNVNQSVLSHVLHVMRFEAITLVKVKIMVLWVLIFVG